MTLDELKTEKTEKEKKIIKIKEMIEALRKEVFYANSCLGIWEEFNEDRELHKKINEATWKIRTHQTITNSLFFTILMHINKLYDPPEDNRKNRQSIPQLIKILKEDNLFEYFLKNKAYDKKIQTRCKKQIQFIINLYDNHYNNENSEIYKHVQILRDNRHLRFAHLSSDKVTQDVFIGYGKNFLRHATFIIKILFFIINDNPAPNMLALCRYKKYAENFSNLIKISPYKKTDEEFLAELD